MNKFRSIDLIKLLAIKHSDDVFLSEVGVRSGGQRMDAWALKVTYKCLNAIGYEVKVSRSDFVNDEKWRTYLRYCTRFYFVCPSGVIQPEELPDDTGLYWVAKTGSRLLRKKLAPFRDIHLSEEFWMSLIFNKMTPGKNQRTCDKTEYWKAWLEAKKEKSELGYNVRGKLREVVKHQIEQVGIKNRELCDENRRLEWTKEILEELGITDLTSWRTSKASISHRVEKFLGGLPSGFGGDISRLLSDLKTVQSSLSSIGVNHKNEE